MNLIIFLSVVGLTLGYEPHLVFRVNFEYTDGTGFLEDKQGIPFSINSGGTHATQQGPVGNTAIKLNGDTFYTSPSDLPLSCLTDIDQCHGRRGNGFTVSMWVRPIHPWISVSDPEQRQWFFSLGHGLDQLFGMRIGMQNRTLTVHNLGYDEWKKVDCEIPPDVAFNEDRWEHIAFKRRDSRFAPLAIVVNGVVYRHDDVYETRNVPEERLCPNDNFAPDTDEQVTQKSRQIIIGASYLTAEGRIGEMFEGGLDDIRFYDDNLLTSEIRDIWRAGRD